MTSASQENSPPAPPGTSDDAGDLEAAAGLQGPVCLLQSTVFRLLGLRLGRHRTGDGADPRLPVWGGGTTAGRAVPGSLSGFGSSCLSGLFAAFMGNEVGDLAPRFPLSPGERGSEDTAQRSQQRAEERECESS